MDIGSLFVADAQSAKLVEPGKAPLDNPAPSPQPTAMLGVTHCEQGYDAAVTAVLAGLLPRHNLGRLARNQDDGVDVHVVPATAGSPQRARALVASRYGLPQ